MKIAILGAGSAGILTTVCILKDFKNRGFCLLIIVYVSHDNKTPISIEDNIFYYENDLSDELGNQTADDNIFKIYVYDMDEDWFKEGINDIVEYIDDQLEEE